jgi:hypothetical protein
MCGRSKVRDDGATAVRRDNAQRHALALQVGDEFDFGLQQQPELGIPTIPAFVARWRADAAAGVCNVAIIRPELIADLKRQGVPLRVVAADSRRAVIANL